MKRRELIKDLCLLPVAGGVIGSGFVFQSCTSPTQSKSEDLFNELGIRTFINAAGTLTYMTGSLMQDEVVQAILSTSGKFCMLDEVQDKVGEKIAQMVHSEAATVTAGCFSAMTLGLAGVLTGTNLARSYQLPHLEGTGMKSEVIVQKSHDDPYCHAFINTGCKMVDVETVEDVEKAINEKTAMMHYLNITSNSGKIKHEEWLALGKKHNIPVSIDIAADVPPVSNLWKFNDMGFDLVFISGGKGIRGPQSAGLLMGKKNLIEAARLNAPPRALNLGRGMKVNKEEIIGMYVAIKNYIARDHDKEWKDWEDSITLIQNAVKDIKGLTITRSEFTLYTDTPLGNRSPRLGITWDDKIIKLNGHQMQDNLRKGNPSIEAGFSGLPMFNNQYESDTDITKSSDPAVRATLKGANRVGVSVWMLKPGEDKIVAIRLVEEFTKAAV